MRLDPQRVGQALRHHCRTELEGRKAKWAALLNAPDAHRAQTLGAMLLDRLGRVLAVANEQDPGRCEGSANMFLKEVAGDLVALAETRQTRSNAQDNCHGLMDTAWAEVERRLPSTMAADEVTEWVCKALHDGQRMAADVASKCHEVDVLLQRALPSTRSVDALVSQFVQRGLVGVLDELHGAVRWSRGVDLSRRDRSAGPPGEDTVEEAIQRLLLEVGAVQTMPKVRDPFDLERHQIGAAQGPVVGGQLKISAVLFRGLMYRGTVLRKAVVRVGSDSSATEGGAGH